MVGKLFCFGDDEWYKFKLHAGQICHMCGTGVAGMWLRWNVTKATTKNLSRRQFHKSQELSREDSHRSLLQLLLLLPIWWLPSTCLVTSDRPLLFQPDIFTSLTHMDCRWLLIIHQLMALISGKHRRRVPTERASTLEVHLRSSVKWHKANKTLKDFRSWSVAEVRHTWYLLLALTVMMRHY